jgi:hypothetical protein
MDGTTAIGTASVINGNATLTTAALSKGNHKITAVYSGNANYTGSTSAALTQIVK